MEYNEDFIKGLLFEKIAGTISEGDDFIAEKAILADSDTREFWEELKSKMKRPGTASFLSGLDETKAWENVETHLPEIPVSSFYERNRRYITAAAMLLIGFPLIWYFFNKQQLTPQEKGTVQQQVYLKTDNGKIIELIADRTINMDGATVHTKQKELSYAPAEASNKDWATLYVPPTKDYKITLPDGTEVWMNSASSLRFPNSFDKKTREVYLTGEAYFKVAHNPDLEFIVHTEFTDIKVHGTSFNVNAYNVKSFATSLITGSVSAIKGNESIMLKPDQQVSYNDDGKLVIKTFDPQEVLSWRNGTYYFHNKSLAEIAQVLSRWYDVKINWKSPAVSEQTFTGEIDKKLPLGIVLSNLELSSGIKAKLESGILTFR
jgi:transmembrane sensor